MFKSLNFRLTTGWPLNLRSPKFFKRLEGLQSGPLLVINGVINPYKWVTGVLTVLTRVISPLIMSASGAHRAHWMDTWSAILDQLWKGTKSIRAINHWTKSWDDPPSTDWFWGIPVEEVWNTGWCQSCKEKVLSPTIQRVFYISGVLRSIDQQQFTGEFLILILEGKIYIYIYIYYIYIYWVSPQI